MAEVKVKVTAQNEVRTGLQQALQETKKFGEEAKRAVSQGTTIDPFKGDDGLGPLRDIQRQARELRELARAPIEPAAISGGEEFASTSVRGSAAIRGLAVDLANATSGGQIFEAVIKRISTAMGGLVAATAAFAIGSLIRRTLEDAAAGLEDLQTRSQALQQSFSDLSAPTTTFDQLASKIRSAAGEIDALEEANRKLQSGIGFQLADYVNSFDLSTAADKETDSATSNVRVALANAIAEATKRELELAKARTEEERKFIALQANREQLLAQARLAGPDVEKRTQELFAAQDLRAAQDLERSLESQAAKQREINQEALRGLEERLAREKQGLADLEQFGGAGIDLRREQTIARIRQLEKQITDQREAAEAKILAARQQAAGTSRAIADFGVDPATLLARAQERLSALENPNIAANMGLTPEQAAAERKRIMLEILGLEQQVTSEIEKQKADRERAAKSLADAIEDREFAGMSPDEQRAKIAADQAALVAGLESGAISPAEAAQRALELARREDGLAGAAGGITGSAGASALQRIGFASNEFFDTRNKKDPADETRRAAEFVKQILDIIKKGEPLVLPSTSS
jgi:hypothetical protein